MDHDVLDIQELLFHILVAALGHLVGLAEGFISVYDISRSIYTRLPNIRERRRSTLATSC